MRLKQKNKTSLGLDISDNNIKICQLFGKPDKITIQALGKYNLKPGIIINGIVKDNKSLAQAIRNLIDKPKLGKISTREIITSLPESQSYLKLIQVEKSPNELSQIINSEIEKNIPISINDIYFDYQKVFEKNNNYNILIGACPKSIIENYLNVINEAKLIIKAMEIESVPIVRSLLPEELNKKNTEVKNYAIIDLGSTNSNMIIYAKNTIAMTLSIPLAGNAVTEQISKSLEIDIEQAEKAKIICGLDKNKARGIINNLLSEMIEELIKRIKDGINYYNNNFQSELGPISKILLSGGGAYIKGIDKIIEGEVGLETTIGDALSNLNKKTIDIEKLFYEKHIYNSNLNNEDQKDKDISLTQETCLSYATAIGLALRGIID